MARLRVPWPLAASQWWRWRYPRLWRGRTFDPHNAQQVLSYAVLRLRRETRDVFLLNHIKALDYALIARHLGLTAADVQDRFAEALFEVSRTVDLIERARPSQNPLKRSTPMSDDKGPFALSRRVVIGAASAAPVVADGGGALADPAVARCAEWMALDAEIDRLGLRWSDLETILVRQKRWERMTPEERGELLPSEEMDAIDKQMEPLFEQREAWLEALPTVRATDIHGVVAKLEVALRVMVHQQGEGYDLFKATMEELRTARCPNCGASVCKR